MDKPPIQIYVNKLENSFTFKIENGYSLELLTPKTMKFLGSKNKITKEKNSENMPHLEITEAVLAFIVILSIMIINKIQEYFTLLFQINLLVAY